MTRSTRTSKPGVARSRAAVLVAAALTAALAVVGAASAALAQDGDASGLSIEDVARLQGVRSMAIAPDGTIAYTVSVPRDPFEEEDGSARSELWVWRGGEARPFITGDVGVGSIAFTPDGRAIAYLAERGDDEHTSLYVIPVDGGESRRLLGHDTSIGAFSFAPGGDRVAVLATAERDDDEQALEKKGFKADVYEEGLRPVEVWIAPIEDGMKAGELEPLELEGSASELAFGPEGKRLVVALAPTPLIDDHYMKRTVHVVDLEQGRSVGAVDHAAKLGEVRWSPDGSKLAMIAGADLNDPNAGRLYVVSASGGKPRDVVPALIDGDVVDFVWRDDATIVYVGHRGVESFVAQVDVASSNSNVLVEPGGPALYAIALADDGTSAALLAETPTHPRELYTMTLDGGALERATNVNPWLADKALATREVVKYRARDGLELEGLLFRPLDEENGERYPLILVVHGGPEAHYSNGWVTRYSSPGHMGAAQGFAVFYPNYRGSTGRGVAFSKMGQSDYAGAEFDDLVDAVDHLVESGLVDRDRVGITGGSYGGFASAWGATALSEHFAASVMFVGISEQISKFGTTDIPNEMYLVHARRWPWNHWDWFRERSPIFHAQKANTPILILHGEEDTRVHPSQSMVLYRYLKTLNEVEGKNVPVRLVLYPGEGHGNRKAAARLDYSMRLMRWMTHYLKGPGGDPPPYALEALEERLDDDDDDDDDEDEDDEDDEDED